MRRARFVDPAGTIRTGEWTDDGIETTHRTYDPDAVDVLPPVEPSKVLGVGRNYRSIYEGTDEDPPDHPAVFFKGTEEVLSGHGDTVTIPPGEVVYEAELGVVIGEQCRNVAEADAEDVIAGYTCANDTSRMDPPGDGTFWANSFDNAVPLGPVVASPDLVLDEPRMRLWLNGEQRQDSAGEEYLFSIPEVIAAITAQLTLEPDDVIMMGTPPPLDALSDGDHVAIEIEGIGRLEHHVEA